jgi:hypothetical protein
MPVGLFATCAVFATAAVPACRSGSVALLTVALVGIVTTLAGLVVWVLHADRLAAARERLADPMHVANWWPDFERQFWRYVEDVV